MSHVHTDIHMCMRWQRSYSFLNIRNDGFFFESICAVLWAHESHFILQMQHRFDAAVAAVAAANAIWFILWFLFWMYAQRCTEYVLILCKMLDVLVQCGMLHKNTFHVEMSTCGICISYTMHGQDNVTHFK